MLTDRVAHTRTCDNTLEFQAVCDFARRRIRFAAANIIILLAVLDDAWRIFSYFAEKRSFHGQSFCFNSTMPQTNKFTPIVDRPVRSDGIFHIFTILPTRIEGIQPHAWSQTENSDSLYSSARLDYLKMPWIVDLTKKKRWTAGRLLF